MKRLHRYPKHFPSETPKHFHAELDQSLPGLLSKSRIKWRVWVKYWKWMNFELKFWCSSPYFSKIPKCRFSWTWEIPSPWVSFQFGPQVMFKKKNSTTIYIKYVYSHCVWPPLNNSDHQEYYMFSRESLQAFMYHCYWKGPHPIYTRGGPAIFLLKKMACF